MSIYWFLNTYQQNLYIKIFKGTIKYNHNFQNFINMLLVNFITDHFSPFHKVLYYRTQHEWLTHHSRVTYS